MGEEKGEIVKLLGEMGCGKMGFVGFWHQGPKKGHFDPFWGVFGLYGPARLDSQPAPWACPADPPGGVGLAKASQPSFSASQG